MSKKKKKEEINFDGLSVEEYIKARNLYLQKYYKKEAEKSWGKNKSNVEYNTPGVSYAVLKDFNHQ